MQAADERADAAAIVRGVHAELARGAGDDRRHAHGVAAAEPAQHPTVAVSQGRDNEPQAGVAQRGGRREGALERHEGGVFVLGGVEGRGQVVHAHPPLLSARGAAVPVVAAAALGDVYERRVAQAPPGLQGGGEDGAVEVGRLRAHRPHDRRGPRGRNGAGAAGTVGSACSRS